MKLAIIDDEKESLEVFEGYVNRYEAELKETIIYDEFQDGQSFLDDFHGGYDLIFLDIAMRGLSGLEVAELLRRRDPDVILIFTTNLSQYAIKGYEVDAFDYLLKPISYDLFRLRMEKVRKILERRPHDTFVIRNVEETFVAPIDQIRYVESMKHYLFFHIEDKIYKMRGILSDIKPQFFKNNFSEINRSLLVNLRFVSGYTASEVIIDQEHLPLSRIYKASFLDDLTRFLGRGGVASYHDYPRYLRYPHQPWIYPADLLG